MGALHIQCWMGSVLESGKSTEAVVLLSSLSTVLIVNALKILSIMDDYWLDVVASFQSRSLIHTLSFPTIIISLDLLVRLKITTNCSFSHGQVSADISTARIPGIVLPCDLFTVIAPREPVILLLLGMTRCVSRICFGNLQPRRTNGHPWWRIYFESIDN